MVNVDNLICNNIYEFRARVELRFYSQWQRSAWTNVSGSIPCPDLFPPTNISAIVLNDSIAQITWTDDNSDESGFRIMRRVTDTWVEVARVTPAETSFIDNTVVCETAYDYKVRAFRSQDNASADSAVVSIFTPICPVLAPISFTSAGNTETSIDLSWLDISDNETGFILKQTFDDSADLTLATLPADTRSYTHSELACEMTNNYELQAFRTISGTVYSDVASLSSSTANCAVILPANFTPTLITRNSVQLTWDESLPQHTSQIMIERALGNQVSALTDEQPLSWESLKTLYGTQSTFSDDTLHCGMTYWYRMQAYNERHDDYSDYSDPIQVITSDCPVPVSNTIGLYQDGVWMFRDGFDNSAPTLAFRFGPQESGWVPLTGDWDGDGIDGIGLYKEGIFVLRDVSERGLSDYVYRFGNREGGAKPIVGDWNGDGQDTVGLYRNGLFILTNSHETHEIDYQFVFGRRESGWIPITGDWTASGRDFVGLYKDGVFQLHNSFSTESSGQIFRFGPDTGNWIPITGDWDADGITTIGLYKDKSWRFRNSNSRGHVEIGFTFGNLGSSAYPIASYRGGEEAIEALAFMSEMPLPDMDLSVDEQEPESTSPTPTEPILVTVSATETVSTATSTLSISDMGTQVEPTVTPTFIQETTASPTIIILPTGEGIVTELPTMTATLASILTKTVEPTIELTITPMLTSPPSSTTVPTEIPTSTQVPTPTREESETEVTQEVSQG